MARRTSSWLLLALIAAAASGCELHSLFDLDRAVEIDETRSQSVDLLLQLDLAEGGKPGVGQDGSPSAISLDSADVTVSQVDTSAGTNEASALAGTLSLRPAGASDDSSDVVLGSLAGLSLKQGATASLKGTPDSAALLLAAHRAGGRFQLVCNLTLPGGRSAHVVLFISLHLAAGYQR